MAPTHNVFLLAVTLFTTLSLVPALKFDVDFVDWNLNTNRLATNPLEYTGNRDKTNHTKSPTNWRFPYYTIFLDRFVNGDPTNDDINGTYYEQDMTSNQLRHGGDLQGVLDSLDYIQGMGVKGIYIAGSPFINAPWGADAYSPLDLTLLDKHFGDIKMWQKTIQAIHDRGMYVIIDQTMATMGDLLGFEGHLNDSTPFTEKEHKVVWKSSRRYLDFDIGNDYNETCNYPVFYNENGFPETAETLSKLKGCYNSDFDQYGDIEAFGVFPDWKRQLAKFASVQDRLREWHPSVMARLKVFSCLAIQMLDFDGYRIDKAMQVTLEAQAEWSSAMRACAKEVGKDNFMVVGEITSGNVLGSVYLGRGRQPDMKPDLTTALSLKGSTDKKYFLREPGNSALDGGAFHYSVYRYLTKFLGLQGNLQAGFDLPTDDWATFWNDMLQSNDFYNANTGEFDPRHLYGVTNQDVFRWPGIKQGTERWNLGFFIITLLLPGAPLVFYGEEQEFYVLDNSAENYVFGRQAFSPTPAWMQHACYKQDNEVYVDWPVEKSRTGCTDITVSYDHRDPSAPLRNMMKHMFQMREQIPSLEHGWLVQKLANQTRFELLRGSSSPSEFGIWGMARGLMIPAQKANESEPYVWLVYHNEAVEKTYTFDCNSQAEHVAFVAPFDSGDKVVNLFDKSDVLTLGSSAVKNGFTGSASAGCISSITMKPYEFRAYVPDGKFVEITPMITGFIPGPSDNPGKHDSSFDSTFADGRLDLRLEFSVEMADCDSITKAITILTTTKDGEGTGSSARITQVTCGLIQNPTKRDLVGFVPSLFFWSAKLTSLADGIHKVVVENAPAKKTGSTTAARDVFLFRFGKLNNPVVWPQVANYSTTLVSGTKDAMSITHSAPGATKWRYTTNWGTMWSDWQPYTGEQTVSISPMVWSGTAKQQWEGTHVTVQYHSAPLGSSSIKQHGDLNWGTPRRLPHVFLHGPFNKWGYDAGVLNTMALAGAGLWEKHFFYEWPANFQFNIWGINPDGQPDATFIYGDVDNDGVADRLPPSSLANNVVNITSGPPMPYWSWKIQFDDTNLTIKKVPQGHIAVQVILMFLLATGSVILAAVSGWIYVAGFYKVKVNKSGFSKKKGFPLKLNLSSVNLMSREKEKGMGMEMATVTPSPMVSLTPAPGGAAAAAGKDGKRRKVLIATMEYNIDDWKISIKIGGLGVMAKLMSTALPHCDIIWVVPVVGDVEYPVDTPAESMFVNIMGSSYEVKVQYHYHENITYVILDAPVFRTQTKADPYIARMDDIESGILYAAWNSCIAEAIRRFSPDIYHINDYHGAAAPLYLLPQTIPVCLSLHNAEFQGLWPMRTPEESKEVCEVFGLAPEIVTQYVQYGAVFNLLHAGASYLRLHQRGFGAVGVSKKYGDRSLARYPIFWSLKNIGQLPNPDPSDRDDWDPSQAAEQQQPEDIQIDEEAEAKRGDLRRQAQEWAGLNVDPDADLFVFVGRWSLQKGVDLIADIFPSVLEKYPKTQLIAVGPVIDLYGKFAALKLEKLMQKYPGRVFSKPEFTSLPPYIFSGAEFALIPSRDEPFGLVAVEFGRKGALGVGARVGGLGQMPGFWYTVESTSPQHLLYQFEHAITSALKCKTKKRALMRAWSAKQRFPVAQWRMQIDSLYDQSIRIHNKEAAKKKSGGRSGGLFPLSPSVQSPNPNTRLIGSNSPLSPIPGSSAGPPSPGADASRTRSLIGPTPTSPGLMSPYGAPDDGPRLSAPRFPWTDLPSSNNRDSTISVMTTDSTGFRAQSEGAEGDMLGMPTPPPKSFYQQSRNSSMLSLKDVVGERHDFKLQKVDQNFTDSNEEFYYEFSAMLDDNLTAKNSTTEMCIESFLKKSEKEWFARYRNAKLGISRDASRSRPGSPSGSRPQSRGGDSRNTSVVSRGRARHRSASRSGLHIVDNSDESQTSPWTDDEFLLGDGYKAPTGIKKFLSRRVGDWPIYSFFLVFGQIISINSYQIVLLTGETSQEPAKLYTTAGTYCATSVIWFFMSRYFKSVYALSIPWFFFGLAFLCLGVAPFIAEWSVRGPLQDAATAFYAAGASHGAIAFALNFGDEGGAPTRQWVTRALVVTGFAQVYSLGLWYWGTLVANGSYSVSGFIGATAVPRAVVICIPICFILWAIGIIVYLGLPDFYRQSPDTIPGFYISLARRKIVPCFFAMVIIQNYWMSAPYGRNWAFLFSSQFVPGWGVVLLAIFFLLGLWSVILYALSRLADEHTWLLPMLAIGLCAPRWAQMLWGVSGMGMYIPWIPNPVAGAVISRCLWLWLGPLDNIQGVGFGMMLLATLTRTHVLAVLMGGQVFGSAFTMLARATSPNRLIPTVTFPDFSESIGAGLSQPWFWACLGFQLLIPLAFSKVFRKEQVSKP